MNQHLKRGLAVAVLTTGMSGFADVGLFEWGINKDGVITGVGDPLPAGSTFDTTTGLGTVRLSFTGAGVHSGVLYINHELSENVNTFFNELGTTLGAPTAGRPGRSTNRASPPPPATSSTTSSPIPSITPWGSPARTTCPWPWDGPWRSPRVKPP